MNLPSLFAELKRRNVYKVAITYAVVAWLLIQIATQVFSFFEIPNWGVRLIVLAIGIGFPIALIIAWALELTPEGLKRTEVADELPTKSTRSRAWIYVVVIAGAISVGLFLAGRYTAPNKQSEPTEVVTKSIAVLPFENLSSDKENAYFAEGIQDEILTRLAKIADLKVISRTSTQHYKSAPENLPQIAKQLGVAHIVEGSVQKNGDAVRVNVQLIKAANDSHLWADTYDRRLTDIFGVESEIAKSIADSLQAKLTGREQQALAVKPTNNPDAYDAYLRGVAAEGQRLHSVYANLKAADFYERAVQLDPGFALAWAKLSRVDSEAYSTPDDPTPARRDAAKRALETAQKLQPNSPETLLALADYQLLVLRDLPTAEATYRQVSNMLPGSSDVPFALARIARRQGHLDEAVAYQEQALVLDPRNTDLLANAALSYGDLRKSEAARKALDRALDVQPNDPDVMAAKASFYQADGNLQEAAKLLPKVDAVTPSVTAVATKIEQLWLERNHSEAVRLLQERFTRYRFRSEIEKGIFRTLLAFSQRFAGDSAGARANAEQARDVLAPLCRNQPSNDFAAIWLSRAYALFNDKNSAYAVANRVKALLKNNAIRGPGAEENIAVIDAIVGNHARAILILTRLLHIPYQSTLYGPPVTPALLRLDPIWDPLRNEPAFQKLCEDRR